MLVSEIKRRVQRRFGDASNIVITSQDIFDWVNDAQLEIVRQTACLTTIATADASTYSADGVALTADFVRSLRVTYNLSGDELPLDFASVDELDNLGVSVTLVKDVPRLYYHKNNRLYLYPSPTATDTNDIKHEFVRQAALVSNDADTPQIPSMYHSDIVTFCMIRAYERDQNYRAMDMAQREFLSAESSRRDDAIVQDDTYLAVQDYDWDF